MKSDDSLPKHRADEVKLDDNVPAASMHSPNTQADASHNPVTGRSRRGGDEHLNATAGRLIAQLPSASAWQRYSTNPFAIIVLATLLGALLIYYSSLQQRELETFRLKEQRNSDQLQEELRRESDHIHEERRRETERSLEELRRETDRIYQARNLELTQSLLQERKAYVSVRPFKVFDSNYNAPKPESDRAPGSVERTQGGRLQKLEEAWKKIDETESAIDQTLNRISVEALLPSPEIRDGVMKKEVKTILGLLSEQETLLDDNRALFGEDIYNQLKGYHDMSRKYVSDKLIGPRGMNLSDVLKKREHVKQSIKNKSLGAPPTTDARRPKKPLQ